MKVLIVASYIKMPDTSGAATHYTGFAKALEKLGVEVHILANSDKEIKLGKKIFIHPSKFSNMPPKRFWTSINSFREAVNICKNYNIDIIQDRCDVGHILGYLTSKMTGLPRIAEINENPLAYEIKGNFFRDILTYPFLMLIKLFWVKSVIADADAIVAVSDIARLSVSRFISDKNKAVKIPNGADPVTSAKHMNLKKFGIKKGDVVAAIVGELGPRQGAFEIVKSMKYIPYQNFKLIFVGGEKRYKKYLQKIQNYLLISNLKRRVLFIGRLEHSEMKNFLASIDFALAPYRESWNNESFGFCPIKILDYMASGKVVVASDTKWAREIIEHDKDGFLVPFKNFSEGIQKIIRLDAKTIKRIESNARKKIIREFTWYRVAKKYLTLYEKFI